MVSDIVDNSRKIPQVSVLILVVMEYGLWLIFHFVFLLVFRVLILVVMEYGLWQVCFVCSWFAMLICLNPCCNGIWSLTWNADNDTVHARLVLILVVMEYGLWLWNVKTLYLRSIWDVFVKNLDKWLKKEGVSKRAQNY